MAGNGKKGVPADGDVARSAPLVDPRAVAIDGRGNLYILERGGHALRVVDRSGKIRTVAGTGKPGDSGDGGDARQARLNGPKHLCVDPEGNVLIADTENHRVRIYRPGDGTIDSVAGTGRKGTKGLGGPASRSRAQPAARRDRRAGRDPLYLRQQQQPNPQDRALRERQLGGPSQGNTCPECASRTAGPRPGQSTPPGP